MFVDVELPLNLPPALSVPAGAVSDTGLNKTVFVDRGNGAFEPREVQTGWRVNGRIEITSGLSEGEKIVVSGNFLIDSESRLKKTASAFRSEPTHAKDADAARKVRDPVCGMTIEVGSDTLRSDHAGKTYYFCSESCKHTFVSNPEQYLEKTPPPDQGKIPAARAGK